MNELDILIYRYCKARCRLEDTRKHEPRNASACDRDRAIMQELLTLAVDGEPQGFKLIGSGEFHDAVEVRMASPPFC